MIIGIDLSLRSTGIVSLNEDSTLSDFAIIASLTGNEKSKSKANIPIKNQEELLIHNAKEICAFIDTQMSFSAIDGIALEGLSFGGISGSKDILQGNFWHVRCEIFKRFGDIPIGIIPITSWRAKVLDKKKKSKYLEIHGKKKYLKQGVVDELPEDVREAFKEYIKLERFKKDSIYDLADAYFVTKFRAGLG